MRRRSAARGRHCHLEGVADQVRHDLPQLHEVAHRGERVWAVHTDVDARLAVAAQCALGVLEQVAWEQSQHGSKSDQRCDILEAQNAVLRKQLEAQGDGDRLVDKRLVASLLVSYLSVDTDADKKREILQVASNLLGLTEEEQMSVGLGGGMPTQDANLFGLKMPSWVFGGGDRGQAAPQHTQHPQQSYEPV